LTRPQPALAPLDPRARAAWLACAWTFLGLASPGVLDEGGSAVLALLGTSIWAFACRRPGRKAALLEWIFASLGWAWIMGWAAYVWPGLLLFIGPGMGAWALGASALLRALPAHWPLSLCAPLAWIGAETLRSFPTPFGCIWMRVGVHLHEHLWISGSARVLGVAGLGFALLALAGLIADAANALFAGRKIGWAHAFAGLFPLLACVLASRWTSPAAMEEGPSVLLVQPGLAQERKMDPGDPLALLRDSIELALEGIQRAEKEGKGPVDLVAFGETMLHLPVVDPALVEELRAGTARTDEWVSDPLTAELAEAFLEGEEAWIGDGLLGEPGRRLLPEGTSFASGAEFFLSDEGRVRRQNAFVVWDADGTRPARPRAGKRHLVPSAETMVGLERIDWLRRLVQSIAGYVPDLQASANQALELVTREGKLYRFSASICYDNAFDDPFLEPLRRGPVDFHLVASNEAWFRRSHEFDQMVAFSRLAAIQSGRSIVRATNAGITLLIGPDGVEVSRLRIGGFDRGEVSGSLLVRVPVPVRAGGRSELSSAGTNGNQGEPLTIFARTEALWTALFLLSPVASLLLASLRGRSNRGRQGG
jgi:apolipoprotein N-acyltransferase